MWLGQDFTLCETEIAFPGVFMYNTQQNGVGSQRNVSSKYLIAMSVLVQLIAWNTGLWLSADLLQCFILLQHKNKFKKIFKQKIRC